MTSHRTTDPDSDDNPWASSEYVEPADRPTAWAAMAAGLANDGHTFAGIAARLWVDEATVRRLLQAAGRAW